MKEQEEKMDSTICKVDLMLRDMENYGGRLESLKNMYKVKVSAMTSIFKDKQEPISSCYLGQTFSSCWVDVHTVFLIFPFGLLKVVHRKINQF